MAQQKKTIRITNRLISPNSKDPQAIVGSNSLYGNSSNYYFDPRGHFALSLNRSNVNNDIEPDPVKLADTLLFTRAIEKISDGVANIPWVIDSIDQESTDEDIEQIKILTKALRSPNRDDQLTFRELLKTIVKDLLVFNTSAIERQPGKKGEKPFWLWCVCPRNIRVNPEWEPNLENTIPRYYERQYHHGVNANSWNSYSMDEKDRPLLNKDLFVIKSRTSSWQMNPLSPVMVAYKEISTYLKLSKGQSTIVSNPIRNYLISLEDTAPEQIGAFRRYWKEAILEESEPPIIMGKVHVEKISADSDSQLFMQYTEHLIAMIAMAFNLSKRDMNLTEHDNRATSEASADSSFQEAVLPLAKIIFEHLSIQVLEYYTDSKYDLQIGEIEPRKGSEEATIATSLYRENVATRNEVRLRLGLEAREDSDVFAAQAGQQGQEGEEGMMPPMDGGGGGQPQGMMGQGGGMPSGENEGGEPEQAPSALLELLRQSLQAEAKDNGQLSLF